MRKLQIITDSCSDLTPELMERYHIDYAQMNTVYEGRTAPQILHGTSRTYIISIISCAKAGV